MTMHEEAKRAVKIWRAGFVNRWHTHPDPRIRNSGDTNHAHSARVALLVHILLPHVTQKDTASEYREVARALYHDLAESSTGDVPYPAKQRSPALAAAIKYAERAWSLENNIAQHEDNALLDLCDILDAILFTHAHAPDVVVNPAWQDDMSDALDMAQELGVGILVRALLQDMYFPDGQGE